jgi:hypothetical protein
MFGGKSKSLYLCTRFAREQGRSEKELLIMSLKNNSKKVA